MVKSGRQPRRATLCAGQEHREAAALSLAGLDRHTAPVSLRDTAHDGQTEARTASFPMRLAIGLEDVRQRIGGDTDAGVLDLQLELRARVDHARDDATAGLREANGVGAQV